MSALDDPHVAEDLLASIRDVLARANARSSACAASCPGERIDSAIAEELDDESIRLRSTGPAVPPPAGRGTPHWRRWPAAATYARWWWPRPYIRYRIMRAGAFVSRLSRFH